MLDCCSMNILIMSMIVCFLMVVLFLDLEIKKKLIIILGFFYDDVLFIYVGCDMLFDLYNEDFYEFIFNCINLRMFL